MVNDLVVCGGTFDHFHKGHESLLRLSLSLGNKVIIGVTSDQYVQQLKINPLASSGEKLKIIEDFEKRRQGVLKFIKKEGDSGKTEIIKISDLFGPTLDKNLLTDAIIVSKDSRRGAEIINQKREELGLKKLSILVAPSVFAEDGILISSARIRNGEIDRVGKLYINPLWLKKDLILPENLRGEFQKPFGELLKDEKGLIKDEDNLIITVGDVTTKKFNNHNIEQNISVIDFRIARKEASSSLFDLGFSGQEKVIRVNNPAGHITRDLFAKILTIFQSDIDQKTILEIRGEEDLTVLPLILVAPLGVIVYYGQPDKGLVKIIVSEENKERAYDLVSKFEPIESYTRGY